MNILTDLYF